MTELTGDGRSAPSALALVHRLACIDPHGQAVIDASGHSARTWTWRQLWAQAHSISALLGKLGVEPGDVVALQLPNRGEAIVAMLAILQAGAVSCPFHPGLGSREIRATLRTSGARVLFTTARQLGIADEVPHVVLVAADSDDRPARTRAPSLHSFEAELAEPAVPPSLGEPGSGYGQLGFTSGTTGEAKPVLHRADTLSWAARLVADRLGISGTDRVLVPCALSHHSGFLYGMWLAWTAGAAQILVGKWDPPRALAAIATWRASFAQLTPTMLVDIMRAVERGAKPPASLRTCVVTGAVTPGGLAERASRVLGTVVCRAWGSTETCMGTLSTPADPPALRWHTDGRPLDGVRLRVTDACGVTLPPGAEGNLEIWSPGQFDGYGVVGGERDREAFSADGWYRTGDLATVDGDGYLRVTGRKADVINRGGLKIPAPMVEGVLSDCDSVAEVAIVAVPDVRLGERACAFVVPAGGRRPAITDIQRHLADRGVTRHYWPEQLELVPALPRNAAGKVQKDTLRQAIEGRGLPAHAP